MTATFFCAACGRHKDTLHCLSDYHIGHPGRRLRCTVCDARAKLMSNPAAPYKTFPNGAAITVGMHLRALEKRRRKHQQQNKLDPHYPD